MGWMGHRNARFLSASGQSTVEYILLLAVVVSLIFLVVNSDRFRDLMGEGGTFATRIKGEMEWNYRFATPGNEEFSTINYPGAQNPSYFNTTRNGTHFIGPINPYGAPTP
jgi:hypothetical protein